MLDTIRQKILIKWNHRKKVAKKLDGKIQPHIVQKLKKTVTTWSLRSLQPLLMVWQNYVLREAVASGLRSVCLAEPVLVGVGRAQESHASMQ